MIVIVLMLMAASLAFVAYSQKGVSAKSRRAAYNEITEANDATQRPHGNSQCESQARAKYVELVDKNGNLGTYQVHYDPSLDKCFLLVTSETGSGRDALASIAMLEAFAGDSLAYYTVRGDSEKLIAGAAPIVCEVASPQTGKTRYCSSHDEFQSLLKPYMQ